MSIRVCVRSSWHKPLISPNTLVFASGFCYVTMLPLLRDIDLVGCGTKFAIKVGYHAMIVRGFFLSGVRNIELSTRRQTY